MATASLIPPIAGAVIFSAVGTAPTNAWYVIASRAFLLGVLPSITLAITLAHLLQRAIERRRVCIAAQFLVFACAGACLCIPGGLLFGVIGAIQGSGFVFNLVLGAALAGIAGVLWGLTIRTAYAYLRRSTVAVVTVIVVTSMLISASIAILVQ
ncbi:MAG: hypothetical protein IR160_03115 [Salinibacterium sp.]|nr:hypothetical protein [Salinibacterium sp.]MBF0671558.1 hypothetical protein [Salinibacterium sp.]